MPAHNKAKEVGLFEALREAKKEFAKPSSSGKVSISTRQQWKYNTTEDMLAAVEPALDKYDLLLYHSKRYLPEVDTTLLVTGICHTPTNKMLEDETVIHYDPKDPKSLGSWITYARRYAIMGLLGLLPRDDEDNDGALYEYVQRRTPSQASNFSEKINAQQIEELRAAFKSKGDKAKKLADDIIGFNKVGSLSELTVLQFKNALRYISQNNS